MKQQAFLKLALLFPYALWAVCVLLTILLPPQQDPSESWNLVALPIIFYVLGIFVWIVPYTILAIGLWLWSRGKAARQIAKVFAFAPIMLAVLIALLLLPLSIDWNQTGIGLSNLTLELAAAVVGMAGFALAYGYFCIGMIVVIYEILKRLQIIRSDDEESTRVMLAPITVPQ